MKRKMRLYLLAFAVMVLSLQSIYGAQVSAMTEQAFAESLSTIQKTGAVAVTGTQKPLTRERAAVLITKYLGGEMIADGLKSSCRFSDVTTSVGEIEFVSRMGVMNGTGSTNFSPQTLVTASQAAVIKAQIAAKLQQPVGWKHICYAISSSSQLQQLAGFNAVSFGWSQLKNVNGSFVVVTDDPASDFKVPAGFTTPLSYAKTNAVETYLMVYFADQEGSAASFLNDPAARAQVVGQLTALSQSLTSREETGSFDGITVDFEGLKDPALKVPYVSFLQELRVSLAAAGKKLNVAVQPTLYYKGYDYKGIGANCDHVILMAHDYAAKSMTPAEMNMGKAITPLTPADSVFKALYEAKTQITDSSKIALQFSFASVQWQSQNGKILNSTAYTPGYDKIWTRLAQAGTKKTFDTYYQSTYATYTDKNIVNTIWFEDSTSLQAKMDLAKLMGITGVSYWRLGILPQGVDLVK